MQRTVLQVSCAASICEYTYIPQYKYCNHNSGCGANSCLQSAVVATSGTLGTCCCTADCKAGMFFPSIQISLQQFCSFSFAQPCGMPYIIIDVLVAEYTILPVLLFLNLALFEAHVPVYRHVTYPCHAVSSCLSCKNEHLNIYVMLMLACMYVIHTCFLPNG